MTHKRRVTHVWSDERTRRVYAGTLDGEALDITSQVALSNTLSRRDRPPVVCEPSLLRYLVRYMVRPTDGVR